eukprot:2773362-Karenia_brevis.AAC.1
MHNTRCQGQNYIQDGMFNALRCSPVPSWDALLRLHLLDVKPLPRPICKGVSATVVPSSETRPFLTAHRMAPIGYCFTTAADIAISSSNMLARPASLACRIFKEESTPQANNELII